MNTDTLLAFLRENEIPKVKKQPKTFLGIAKMPHYENVMSNIYAFFFQVQEVHGMKELFIQSLLDLIQESALGKDKNVSAISDFEVATEVATKKGGRIDIVLSSDTHAIIIENKIYHTLQNDLEDYWHAIQVADNIEANKIGIVLSLHKLAVNNSNYINITHLEFLKRVMLNLGHFVLEAREKYMVFLKDFYQNTVNMSKKNMEVKDLKFYFEHKTKIQEVVSFYAAMRSHIPNQVEEACQLIDEELQLPKSKGDGNRSLRYFISPKNKDLMITVYFDKLLTEKWIALIVEMKYSLLKNKEQYNAITFTEKEDKIIKKDFYDDTKESWCHFAAKKYVLNEEEIADLKNFVATKLVDDGFLSIYRKLNDFVSKN
jgi:hypothetical protein